MQITFITLFPESFDSMLKTSILGRAIEKDLVKVDFVNIRDFGFGKYNRVDDTPCGGGAGQVMKVDVVHKAIERAKISHSELLRRSIVLMTPAAPLFKQVDAKRYATLDHLIIVCGRYEGIDARIDAYVNEKRSIGDFVISGGEIAALAIADATMRMIPGSLGNSASIEEESFSDLLEYRQYTRPIEYDGQKVPDVYMSGDHKKIEAAHKAERLEITKKYRPDLL